MLSRRKYIQQSHKCLSPVPLSLRWLWRINGHKSPSIDQIPAEVITAGSRTIRSEIRKLISSIWNTEELPEQWKELIIAPIYNKGDETDYISYSGISLCQLRTKFYPTSCYCNVILLILYSPGVLKIFVLALHLGYCFSFLWPTINWIDIEYFSRNSYLWKISLKKNKKKNIEFYHKCHCKKLQAMQLFAKFS